jgi:site-specific DNA recombinase
MTKQIQSLEIFNQFAKGAEAQIEVGNNCVIYTRVSTKDQADNNMSLTTQLKLCQKFCEKNNYEIIESFGGTFESAKTDERKEFNRMLAFIKKSKVKISQIVVYSIDRFSRSGANAIYIKEQLKKSGVTIQSVSQPTDTSTSSGRLQQNIHFVFSDFDNELRRDKCVTGMREALLRGDWCVHAPRGYDHIKQNGKRAIVLNDLGRALKNVFEWKVRENLPLEEMSLRMEKLGFKLDPRRISEVIKNPFYCGLLSHNLLGGKIVEGNHEKLISKEIFLQANELMQQRKTGYAINTPNNEIPLKRFIKCDTCGTFLRGYKAYKNQEYYYKCGTTECHSNKRADSIHNQFSTLLKSFQFAPTSKLKDQLTKYITKEFNAQNKVDITERTTLEKQLQEINKKLERLEERFLEEDISKDLFEKFTTKLKAERTQLQKQLQKVPEKTSNLENTIEKAINLSSKLNTAWHSADYIGRHKIQYLLFPDGISYNRKNDECRTLRVNEIFRAMASLARVSEKEKPELSCENSGLTGWVVPPGLEPGTPCADSYRQSQVQNL